MTCKLYGNKKNIMERILEVKKERLSLMGTGKTKEFDKNLISYVYCDGVRHIRTDGVNIDTVLGKCNGFVEFENAVKAEEVIEKETRFSEDFSRWKGEKKYIKTFKDFLRSEYYTILLSGNVGTGKTFICRCLQKHEIENGKKVIFYMAKELSQIFLSAETYNKDFIEKKDAVKKYDDLLKADIVIVDDLGTEKYKSEHFVNQFQAFLEKKKGKLIITTNFRYIDNATFPSVENKQGYLNYRYTTRIMSRIMEKSQKINLTGPDHRTRKIK